MNRPTQAQELYSNPSEAEHKLAMKLMEAGHFKAADTLFEASGDMDFSRAYAKYCETRLKEHSRQTVNYKNEITGQHEAGTGTWYDMSDYVLYIPETVSSSTRSVIYYPGSNGEKFSVINRCSALFSSSVDKYLQDFSPSSIMLFWRSSGYPDIIPTVDKSYHVMESVARDYGIAIHDLVFAGSSNGGYAALRAAAYVYMNYGVPATSVLVYDMGMSFTVAHCLPTEEEYAALVEEQTAMYFFEQRNFEVEFCPAVMDMVNMGMNVNLVICQRDEHNQMTHDGFMEGTLSWATGEMDTIRDDYYTIVGCSPSSDEIFFS